MRESSRSTVRAVAARLLAERVAFVHPPPGMADTRLSEILDARAGRFAVEARRSLARMRFLHDRLREVLGDPLAAEVSAPTIEGYTAARVKAGASAGTVNLELGALRAAFKMAHELGRVAAVPRIKMLPKPAPRAGFVTDEQVRRVLASLPDFLRRVVVVAMETGMRLHAEVLALTWQQVDLEGRWVHLWAGRTKSGAARAVPLTSAARSAFEEQVRAALKLDVQPARVFFYPYGHRRQGAPIKSIRWSWGRAVRAAGLAALTPHDLRRTCARRLAAAGIPRTIAQKWLGHASPAVHDSYAIGEGDLLTNARNRLDEIAAHNRPQNGHAAESASAPPCASPDRPPSEATQ